MNQNKTKYPVQKLHEISRIISGVGFPRVMQGKQSGKYPFAKVGDISQIVRNGGIEIGDAPNSVDDDDVTVLRAEVFPPKTIVFAKIGEAIRQNFRALTATQMLFDNNVMGVIPNQAVVDPVYLLYFLRTVDFYTLASKTTVPSIRRSSIESIEIPVPSLQEQIRLVNQIKDCMKRVDEIRILQAEALREATSLFEALIEAQIELDWIWHPIFEIITEVRNGWSWKESPTGQSIQVLRLSAVRNLSLDLNEVRTVCLESKQSEEFSLKKDDVFMVRGNGSKHLVGCSAISTDDHPTIVFNDLLIRLRFTSEMLPEFANFMLHSRKVREQIEQTAKTAAGIWKINQTGIRSLKLPCPPISIQKEKLAALHEGLAASRQILQHFSQTDTKALSAAILRKAFAGEL